MLILLLLQQARDMVNVGLLVQGKPFEDVNTRLSLTIYTKRSSYQARKFPHKKHTGVVIPLKNLAIPQPS